MTSIVPGPDLAQHPEMSQIFKAWLAGDTRLGSAAEQWHEFLNAEPLSGLAPAWANDEWRDKWLEDLSSDLPNDTSRHRFRENVSALASGAAGTVITGQQPGFLGGPLYSLLKAAAAIAAAEARTSAGYRTVPVFWLADDDDDRREAFQPMLYDLRRQAFLTAMVPEGAADVMLGAAPAAEWGQGASAWLLEQEHRNELARDLGRLWQEATTENLSWGRLQRRALLRVFQNTDLVVVSGNDSAMHQAAATFYEDFWARHQDLLEAVYLEARKLEERGYHAQIGSASLERPLNVAEGSRRFAMPDHGRDSLPLAGKLRPGVVARSPVQDWLFRPAAVVVGPGELAYLKQLEPVYQQLGLPRAPLLPRLFGQLELADLSSPRSGSSKKFSGFSDPGTADQADRKWLAAAAEVTDTVLDSVSTALLNAGSHPNQAADQARNQVERWRQSLAQLLARENRRSRQKAAQDSVIPWIHPLGKRQERTMASHWATALWGDDLMPLLAAAAREHFAGGAEDHWRELTLVVPNPEGGV